jgi:hypothetical protein
VTDPPPVSAVRNSLLPELAFMMEPAIDSQWCDADKELALQITALCAKPPSKKPREPGQRAIVAIARRPQFGTDEAAWSAYGSSMQRFYEWKPVVDAALAANPSCIPALPAAPMHVQAAPQQIRATAAEEAHSKQLHAEAQARYRKRQRETAEVAEVAQEADALDIPVTVMLAREEQPCREDFVGSEAEWQEYTKCEERRRAVWVKWMEQREAMIEALPVEHLYYVAGARGRRRESLLEAASRGEMVGCACGAAKQGLCTSCEGHGGMVLYRELGGDTMHKYMDGVGLHWSRFVRVDQATGLFENEIMYVDDGWGQMRHTASLNKMLKHIRSVPEAALLPIHPDIDLWQAASENRTARLDSLRVWRTAELAAGRDGLTKWERYDRDQHVYTGCEHCGCRYCRRGIRCPSNPNACPCVHLPYACGKCRGEG